MKTLIKVLTLLFLFLITLMSNTRFSFAVDLDVYTEPTSYVYDATDNASLVIEDVSGDGADDMLYFSGDNSGTMYVYLNGNLPQTGEVLSTALTGYNVRYTNLGTNLYGQHRIATGDIDNDGSTDILVSTESALYGFLADDIAAYQNQTLQTVNVSTTPAAYLFKMYRAGLQIGYSHGQAFYLTDISGDGANDIVLSDDNNFWIYYVNNSIFGSVSHGTQLNLATSSNYNVLMTSGFSGIMEDGDGFTVGDFTGDGKSDVVALISNLSYGTINVVLGSQLSAIAGTGNSLDLTSAANSSIRIKGTSTLAFYENYTGLGIYDVTGDGDPDLEVALGGTSGSGPGYLYVFSNELAQTWEGVTGTDVLLSTNTVYSYSISGEGFSGGNYGFAANNGFHVADINENGINDLVIGDDYYSTGCTNCGVAYVILDNLLADFAVSSAPSNTFSLGNSAYFTLKIKGAANSARATSTSSQGNGGIFLGDVNSDGYNDLVVTYSDGWSLYLSDRFVDLGITTGTSWTTATNVDRRYTGSWCGACRLSVGDLNDNGANDLAISNSGRDESYFFLGGSTINSLGASLGAEVQSNGDDATSDPQGGTKSVILTKSSIPVALVTTSFTAIDGLDWSVITADVDSDAGKSVATNIESADGTGASHSLYVPKLAGALGVYVCPDATNLAGVTDSCTNGYELSEGESGLTEVTIDSVDYWRISGLTGTGAQNVLDTDPPVNGNFVINGGAAYTTSTSVTLTISATDELSDVSQMEISEDSSFTGASWEAYSTSKSFTLSSTSGTKTVYIKYKDSNDNESSSYSDSIILDSNSPGKLRIGLKEDKLFTVGEAHFELKDRKFKLYVDTFDSTTDVDQIKVSEHSDFEEDDYEDYDGDLNIKLSNGAEKKYLYFRLKDSAGNTSKVYKQLVKYNPNYTKNLIQEDDDDMEENPILNGMTEDTDVVLEKIGTIQYSTDHKNYFYTENFLTLLGKSSGIVSISVDGDFSDSTYSNDTNVFSLSLNLTDGKHDIVVGNTSFSITIDPSGNSFPTSLKTVLGIQTSSEQISGDGDEKRVETPDNKELIQADGASPEVTDGTQQTGGTFFGNTWQWVKSLFD
ncbi:VCBS repeat-containing protein [candidate division WWE3 bacterium]|nr:VCBS repeat-containing protein [candidate division WWE3 bacterium]